MFQGRANLDYSRLSIRLPKELPLNVSGSASPSAPFITQVGTRLDTHGLTRRSETRPVSTGPTGTPGKSSEPVHSGGEGTRTIPQTLRGNCRRRNKRFRPVDSSYVQPIIAAYDWRTQRDDILTTDVKHFINWLLEPSSSLVWSSESTIR